MTVLSFMAAAFAYGLLYRAMSWLGGWTYRRMFGRRK